MKDVIRLLLVAVAGTMLALGPGRIAHGLTDDDLMLFPVPPNPIPGGASAGVASLLPNAARTGSRAAL